MDRKEQHVIPSCYQKSWLAPDCPRNSKFEPYVWLLSKDGTTKTRKAPKHVFVENEKYTIRLTDGSRGLVVEDTLMQTEDAFVSVLPKIKNERELGPLDRAQLCIFLAAMHARTNATGQRFTKFFGDLHKLVVNGEKIRNAPPITSLQTEDIARHAHQRMVQAALQTVPQMLFRMSLAILVTDDRLGFITSDNPCNLYDPDGHRRPPGLRAPNLSNPKIEITMPLTPRHTLLISHSQFKGYTRATPEFVDQLNRMARFHCLEHFISLTGETKPFWFEAHTAPADAWENTAEGKHALGQARLNKKRSEAWQNEYRKSTRREESDEV